MIRILKRLLCLIVGCNYNFGPFGVFMGNRLYYCRNCGCEMFDRSPADLIPMTDDDLEWTHREHAAEQERL
jgi:hypothetical protein